MTVYLTTHILKTGRGDSIVLELPREDDKLVLGFIDCHEFPVLEEYLRINNLDNPDLVQFIVATHPHYDHIGGLQQLLEKYGDITYMFWDSGYVHTSLTYENLSQYLEEHSDIITWYPRTGLQVLFGRLGVRVLSPPDPIPSGTASDINNSSIVMRLTYGTSKLLFAGDAQFGNWSHCSVSQGEYLDAQVLKVSHHGSKHGTFLEALEAITPKIAVISGINNLDDPNGEFPHPLTQDALRELDVEQIYCTHEHGYITIKSTKTSRHSVYHGDDPDLSNR
ncbi:MAG: ComEC/Rec2 family competence protein [Candidatus Thorarchaeota archaeon]